MAQQKFQADTKQNHAADEFHIQAKTLAARHADDAPNNRENETDQPNHGGGGKDEIAQWHENKSRGQRIDARRHGHYQQHTQRTERRFVVVVRFVLFQTFDKHFSAQITQNDKRQPVVDFADLLGETHASKPPDERHQALEKPEKQGHAQHFRPVVATVSNAAGNGNRKTVHRQAYRNQYQIEKGHAKLVGKFIKFVKLKVCKVYKVESFFI